MRLADQLAELEVREGGGRAHRVGTWWQGRPSLI
jgi:hypothetical protein